MVLMGEESIEGIPALHAFPAEKAELPLPTIFFFHGYTSSKELNACFGYLLAQAGFRVVMPEAPMHGARFNGDEGLRSYSFWEILKTNIDELPLYRDHYARRGLIEHERIGVGGTSMGGFAALGCLARYRWIKAAANYMGSAYFTQLSTTLYPPPPITTGENQAEALSRMEALHEYDPSRTIAHLANRPLFVWHGEQDEIIPFEESRRLRDYLLTTAKSANLTFLSDAKAGHKVPMAAVEAGVEFFRRQL